MGCGCKKNEQFQVVTAGGEGRAVFTSTKQEAAVGVSKRYAGSVVKNTKTGVVVHTNPQPAAGK